MEAARQAAASDNWFAALAIALTLPDICGAVDDPGTNNSKARYVTWWDRYMADHYRCTPDEDEEWYEPFTYLPGSEAYALRCAYLHSGTDDVDRNGSVMKRIGFLGPPSSAHLGFDEQNRKLNVGLEQFVEWVCVGVETWLAQHQGDPIIEARLDGLVAIIPSAIRLVGRPTQP